MALPMECRRQRREDVHALPLGSARHVIAVALAVGLGGERGLQAFPGSGEQQREKADNAVSATHHLSRR